MNAASSVLGATGATREHIAGLDSLRFLAAIWVAMSHGAALPLKAMLHDWGTAGYVVAAVHSILFNGVAAVTVFFVISGFCIHYPNVGTTNFDTIGYVIRRYVRIGIPLLACLLIISLSNDDIARAGNGVLWSVYCELIYYSMYPFLRVAFRRFGISAPLAVSTLIACALVLTHWSYTRTWQFGLGLTWAIGLPSWLIGCSLAERITTARRAPVGGIWAWRAIAWFYTIAAGLLVGHSPIVVGAPATSLIFSFYCAFWLERELRQYAITAPMRWLEWGGSWSYSLYLTHAMIINAWTALLVPVPPLAGWLIEVALIVACALAFHFAVERPSHLLARSLGRTYSGWHSRKVQPG